MKYLLILLLLCGCSLKQQIVKRYPCGTVKEMVVNKIDILYWSKFQADSIIEPNKMEVNVYNAEARPDPNSIGAVVEGVARGIK